MFGFNKKNEEIIVAPLTGTIVPLEEVPDATFAEKMLGDGIAVEPTGNIVVAPCDGMVTLVSDTKHAVAMTTDQGVELLIHIGLDTVQLAGEGFTQLVEAGNKVTAGTPLVELDLDLISSNGFKLITPVVITNSDDVKLVSKAATGPCEAGKTELLKVEL